MKEIEKRIITSAILLLILFLTYTFSYFLIFILLISSILGFIEIIGLNSKIFFKRNFLKYLLNAVALLYFLIFSVIFLTVSISNDGGNYLIFSFLLTCVASDIGGLVFGRTFKGKKLTKISPNKTISGSIGSYVFSIITLNLLFLHRLGIDQIDVEKILYTLFLSLFVSTGCQMGDLFISFLKRKARVKDTGKLLPGHGGILDRIDGILLGVPLGLLAIIFI